MHWERKRKTELSLPLLTYLMKDDVFTHDCVTCFNDASIYCDHPCCQQRARNSSERTGASLPFQNNSSRQVANRKESKRNVATNKSSKVTPTINPPKNLPSLNQLTANNSSMPGSVCLPSVCVSHTNLTCNTTTRLLPPFNVISVASLNLPSKLQLGHKYIIKMRPSSASSARTKVSCTASGKPDQSNDELPSNTLSNAESTTLTWTVTSCSASPKQYNKTLVSNYALSSTMSSLGGNQAPESKSSFAGLGSKYITSQIWTSSKVQLSVPLVSFESEKPHLSYSAPAISVLKSPSQILPYPAEKQETVTTAHLQNQVRIHACHHWSLLHQVFKPFRPLFLLTDMIWLHPSSAMLIKCPLAHLLLSQT